MRILIVEDNYILAENLADALKSPGYVSDIVGDGEAAWRQIEMTNYDLILLDIVLPKLDGITLSQLLRAKGFDKPIMMMTARDTIKDEILGLDSGANDYVVKPFNLSVLLARLRALTRPNKGKPPILVWKELRLNPSTHTVTYQNQLVPLTPKEFAIVEFLLRNEERVVSRREIIENIWSFDDSPSEEAVKAHIKGIRHKLNEVGADKSLIKTIHGVGYHLDS